MSAAVSVPVSVPGSVPVPVPPVFFRPVFLCFVDNKKRTLSRFAVVDNLPDMLDIFQLILDTCVDGLDSVTGLDDSRPGKMLNASRVAARYGLRRRSFDERLENVRTYTLST